MGVGSQAFFIVKRWYNFLYHTLCLMYIYIYNYKNVYITFEHLFPWYIRLSLGKSNRTSKRCSPLCTAKSTLTARNGCPAQLDSKNISKIRSFFGCRTSTGTAQIAVPVNVLHPPELHKAQSQ